MTEWLPVELTDTIGEVCESVRRRILVVRGAGSASSGEANLTVEWVGKVRYEHPATWTEAEAKRQFLRLSAQVARDQCMHIIELLPAEVVPTILPQLQDLAEYEIRMQRVREEVQRPGITESWISLPITA